MRFSIHGPAVLAAVTSIFLATNSFAQSLVFPDATLVPSPLNPVSASGTGLAANGSTMIIGAPNSGAGSAFVYTRTGSNTWTQQATLTPNDGASGDSFGYSVAISNTAAVVGAYKRDDACQNNSACQSGAVYVFRKNGTRWTFEQKLLAPDAAAGNYFGYSVAISENTIIVGSYGANNGAGPYSGAAYIYEHTGGSWSFTKKLVPADGAQQDFFGASVSISGTYALVGAYYGDGIVVNSGAAYLFHNTGTTWVQTQKIFAADGANPNLFGASLAISGSRAIVGTRWNDAGGIGRGAAYVFKNTGGTWSQEQKLTASDGRDYDSFGSAVNIDGSTAVIGAYGVDDGWFSGIGAAYRFKLQGATWVQQAKMRRTFGSDADMLGSAVAIGTGAVFVGGPGIDNALPPQSGGMDSGATLQFNVTYNACGGDITADGIVNVDDLLVVINSWGLCPGCHADVNADGEVDVDDLLAIINSWGMCP